MKHKEVCTEVAGSVWKLEIGIGAKVREGDILVIVESMKMEIPVTASADGLVVKLLVAEGDVVVEDQPVVLLELLT